MDVHHSFVRLLMGDRRMSRFRVEASLFSLLFNGGCLGNCMTA